MRLSETRNHDFVRAVKAKERALILSGEYTNREKLLQDVILNTAPRYYINFETALRQIRRLMKGEKPRAISSICLTMYYDIMQAVSAETKRSPNTNFHEVLFTVLCEQTAPRFYISINYAKALYIRLNKRKR